MQTNKYKQETMLKFNEFVNENLSNVFNKRYSFEDLVLSDIKSIIMQEEAISEKNFTYINAMNMSFDSFMNDLKNDQEFLSDIQSFKNKRTSYAAEFIYDKYFKDKFKISM